MDNTAYTTLTRQLGLIHEMQIVANNIANAATTGYRQEGLVFSEYVLAIDGGPSVSMATANVRRTSEVQGALTMTRAPYDFAVEGDGFFLIQTPQGERLTRAGAFSPSATGDLVTNDGYPVLDLGGAPVFVPPDAGDLALAADGTLSAGGQPLAQLAVVEPVDPEGLIREDGVRFRAEGGFQPVEIPRVVQGFLETSNVDPVTQIARMIEVQRAYELGQSFLDREDQRIRGAITAMTR